MSNQLTLLIIDDSRLTRSMIRQVVRDHFPDWNILEAGDTEAARAIIAENPVDFVTLDVNMPGEDGLVFLPTLRELCPQARICVVTANLQEETRKDCERLGAEYLSKPVREEPLMGFLTGEPQSG